MSTEPTTHEHKGESDGNELDDEGDGLLLDLGCSLEDSDYGTEQHTDEDGWSGEDKNKKESLVGHRYNLILKHILPKGCNQSFNE